MVGIRNDHPNLKELIKEQADRRTEQESLGYPSIAFVKPVSFKRLKGVMRAGGGEAARADVPHDW